MSIERKTIFRHLLVLVAASLLVATGCGPEENGNNGNNGNNGECTPTNGGVEICDGIDNDCNGEIDDDADDATAYYTDGDGDGYGAPDSEVLACEEPSGDDIVTQGGDCDDSDDSINPDATEICDGVDNNCDDEIDSGSVEPQDCATQTGVCQGSQTSTCDSGDYAMCTADDFGADYAESDDEAWKCDGLDNDCDEETDEFCCAADEVPPSVSVATAELVGTEHPFDADEPPTFVPAADSAPEGAAFLSAWISDTNEISLQHYDEFGEFVGSAETVDSPETVNSIALVPLSDGYEVVWSTYAEESGGSGTTFTAQLNAQSRNADLTQDGFPETVSSLEGNVSEAAGYTELEAVAIENTVGVGFVVYTEDNTGAGTVYTRRAGAVRYDLSDREATLAELDLSSGDSDENFSNVSTHVHDGDFLFAWGEPEQDRLSVRVFAADGTAGATVDADLQGNLRNGRIDAVSLSDNELLVFDSESGVSGAELVATTITLDSGDVSTDAVAVGRQPSIEGTDEDGDGFADRVTVLWQKLGGSGGGELVVRSMAVDSLAPDTEAELALGYTFTAGSPPAIFQHEVGLGLTWRASGPSSRDVFYLPFSTTGIGICPPQ